MSLSRNQLNKYLSEIDIQGKACLDIGVQDKPTKRLTKGNPSTYWTTDVDPQWNPDVVGDLNQDPETWEWRPNDKENPSGMRLHVRFDVAFCIEVLEHCWNPVKAVENICYFLKPGGTAYISTPFINPHHDYVDYLRYTNEWYRDVLPKVGFEDVQIYERVATFGKVQLKVFYDIEGLRISKIRPEHGKYTYPIGYFVTAKKKGGGKDGRDNDDKNTGKSGDDQQKEVPPAGTTTDRDSAEASDI